jgi:hypothetical protein
VVVLLPFLYLGWRSKEVRHRIEVIRREGAFLPTREVRPTRRDPTNTMAIRPSGGSTALTFGPVIEGVISLFDAEKTGFDLDSGKYVALPTPNWMSADKLRQAGVDLYHSSIQSNHDCLDATGLLLVHLEGASWEKVMPASVIDAISRAQKQRVTFRISGASMRPGIYAFFNGTIMGVLQNEGKTGPSPGVTDGVKFRYRRLSDTATSPATPASAR